MEYRNSGVNSHFGGGLVAGVDRNAGTEVLGSTIAAVSDSNNANLTILAKGTGNVQIGDSSQTISIGGSTTQWKLVTGESSWRAPAVSSVSIAISTMTMTGVSTGDLIISMDFRGLLSSVLAVGTYTPSSAAECKIQLVNPSTANQGAGSSGRVRWAYLDRT